MKLGSKKTKQAELIDALGGEALATTPLLAEASAPHSPSVSAPPEPKNERGSLPDVEHERSIYASLPT